ncbi:MAG: hypothetical protein U0790_16010 [Isosphaeraceae bacterium]
MEDAVRQGLVLLGGVGVPLVRGLIGAEAADPDLEPGVLLELAELAERGHARVDLVGQELELAAGEVPLRVPEQAVLGGELARQLGLEAVELAAELAVLVQRGAELAAGVLQLLGDLLEVGPRLVPDALDLGLRGGDQLLGVGLRLERRLELRELPHQFLERMLIRIGLLQGPRARRPDHPEPLDGLPGPRFGIPKLLRRLLGLRLDLPRPRLRLGLPD